MTDTQKPELRMLHKMIREDLARMTMKTALSGIVDPSIKIADVSEIVVNESIGLIASFLIATGQSPDFDQLAADGVRLQLFDRLRSKRKENPIAGLVRQMREDRK